MKRVTYKFLLRTILTIGLAEFVGGCGEFFKTDFIKDKSTEIINRQEDLIKKYKEESGIELQKHPQRTRRIVFYYK